MLYTLEDFSAHTHKLMKAHLLAYALDHKWFLNSQAGTTYVSDNHPEFLSYLFLHLDPWGIESFNHPKQSPSQHMIFETQVHCLLHQHRLPFVDDPNLHLSVGTSFKNSLQAGKLCSL